MAQSLVPCPEMLDADDIIPSFLDELEKIAASMGRLRIAQARRGRRPISVANFLKKDAEGKLFKKADPTSLVDPNVVEHNVKPRKKYELPTRVEVGDSPNRVPGT